MVFDDINIVEKLDTRVNFIIKCADNEELEELKSLLGVKKKMLTYEEYTNKLSQSNKDEYFGAY